jgi:hypothetical protein
MAEHLTGWRSPASRYSRAKNTLEDLERRKARVEKSIEDAKAELAKLPALISEARGLFLAEQRRVDVEVGDEKAIELIAVAKRLDTEGETPEMLGAFTRITAELRTLRRAACSHEQMQSNLARLRKLDSARGVKPMRHRTFTALAESWLRPAPSSSEAA